MSLSDWAKSTNDSAPPLTKKMLDDAMRAVAAQPMPPPRHDCRFDGHVAHFMSTRCVYCNGEIRELTPDENRFRLGEFF